jgi:capsular polysaccharide biosynthesis protein
MTSPLSAETFDQVTLLPCLPDPRWPNAFSFGAFGRDGAAIPAFAHPWCEDRQPDGAVPRKPGRFIYGGLLMDHFGHFILEAMARLWFIRAHPELPVLWHDIALPIPHTPWPGWRQQAWRLLGLDRHVHHVIYEPGRFDHVIVPRPGLTVSDGLHPSQAEALAVVPPKPPSGERVWLSRAALPAHFGRLEGEEALQRRLAEQGWIVLQPETMEVADQAAVFARADTVSGFAGSAFHAVLLCAAPRARLRILRRPSVETTNYDIVARALDLDQAHIEIPFRPFGAVDAWTTFELANPDAAAAVVVAAAGWAGASAGASLLTLS